MNSHQYFEQEKVIVRGRWIPYVGDPVCVHPSLAGKTHHLYLNCEIGVVSIVRDLPVLRNASSPGAKPGDFERRLRRSRRTIVATKIIPMILPSTAPTMTASVFLTVGVEFTEVLGTVDEAPGADEVNAKPEEVDL